VKRSPNLPITSAEICLAREKTNSVPGNREAKTFWRAFRLGAVKPVE
jgi:hypothetical protein